MIRLAGVGVAIGRGEVRGEVVGDVVTGAAAAGLSVRMIESILSDPLSSNATARVSSSGVNVTSTVAVSLRSAGLRAASIT